VEQVFFLRFGVENNVVNDASIIKQNAKERLITNQERSKGSRVNQIESRSSANKKKSKAAMLMAIEFILYTTPFVVSQPIICKLIHFQ